jgi:hypothetical protein
MKSSGKEPSDHAFALQLLASQFTGTADSFGLLPGFLLGRFLEMLLELHFTENAFALELFLQSPEGLVDVIVANTNLHVVVTTFLSLSCIRLQEVAV